jgi:hypothetical protein
VALLATADREAGNTSHPTAHRPPAADTDPWRAGMEQARISLWPPLLMSGDADPPLYLSLRTLLI